MMNKLRSELDQQGYHTNMIMDSLFFGERKGTDRGFNNMPVCDLFGVIDHKNNTYSLKMPATQIAHEYQYFNTAEKLLAYIFERFPIQHSPD